MRLCDAAIYLPPPRISKSRSIEPDMDDSIEAAKEAVRAARHTASAAKDAVTDTLSQTRQAIDQAVQGIDTLVQDTIAAAKDSIADSASQSELILDSPLVQEEPSLLLPIVVVALALVGCLYMAYLYRKRHQT